MPVIYGLTGLMIAYSAMLLWGFFFGKTDQEAKKLALFFGLIVLGFAAMFGAALLLQHR